MFEQDFMKNYFDLRFEKLAFLVKYHLFGVVCFFLFSVTSLISVPIYMFDNLSNFVSIYFGGSVLFLITTFVLFSLNRKILWLITPLVVSITCTLVMLSPYMETELNSPQKADISVMLFNINCKNKEYDSVISVIKKANADVVIIQEVSHNWHEQLQLIKKEYPFSYEYPTTDYFGFSVYSKFSMKNTKLVSLQMYPVLLFDVEIKGQPVSFAGMHTVPPYTPKAYNLRNAQLEGLAEYAGKSSTPFILAGDFNVTMFAPTYKTLEKTSGLVNVRKNRGLWPTWPSMYIAPVRIPIDHILHSKELETTHVEVIKDYAGSDHYPIVAGLRVKE